MGNGAENIKLPPHDKEAEAAVIGSLLVKGDDPAFIAELSVQLAPEDFYGPRFKETYRTIIELSGDGNTVDLITVKDRVQERMALTQEQKDAFMAELMEAIDSKATTFWNVKNYAGIIRKHAIKRKVIGLIHNISKNVDRDIYPNGELDELKALTSAEKVGGLAPRPYVSLLEEAKRLQIAPRVKTGIEPLDVALGGGWREKWLAVIGAFTGGGKTTVAIHQASHFAIESHPVLAITTELSAPEFAGHIQATLEGMPYQELPNLQIFDETTDIEKLIPLMERWMSQQDPNGKLPIIVIDYIQRITSPENYSREREVAVVAEKLQQFSRRMDRLLLLCAAQLNRQSQTDEEPELHHLRESGLVEQVADVVILLNKVDDDKMTMALKKQRGGKAGTKIDLTVDWKRCAFGIVDDMSMWRELAERVSEYVVSVGGTASIRDVSRAVSWGGRGKHPTQQTIAQAAERTLAFQIKGTKVIFGRQ